LPRAALPGGSEGREQPVEHRPSKLCPNALATHGVARAGITVAGAQPDLVAANLGELGGPRPQERLFERSHFVIASDPDPKVEHPFVLNRHGPNDSRAAGLEPRRPNAAILVVPVSMALDRTGHATNDRRMANGSTHQWPDEERPRGLLSRIGRALGDAFLTGGMSRGMSGDRSADGTAAAPNTILFGEGEAQGQEANRGSEPD
jgi:hypothetical protein